MRKKILNSLLLVSALAMVGGAGIGWAAPPGAPAQTRTKAKKAADKSSKPAGNQATPKLQPVEGSSRDPFKLPVLETATSKLESGDMVVSGPLPPGSRGLIIGQLKLEGIVRQGKASPKMIAVLANPANRAFFLHENDPLYNGVVTRITSDSVYFREDVRDAAGKTTSREVVKKLGPASGEKQQ